MARRRHDADWEQSPLELLEQAFHVLRRLPLSALAWAALGPLPFAAGLLYFWSEMSRSGDAALTAPAWTLGMTALWAWLKVCHGLFARSVWAGLADVGTLPALTVGGFVRRTAALWAVTGVMVPLQAILGLLLLPLGHTSAVINTATALAYTQDMGNDCLRSLTAGTWKATAVDMMQSFVAFLLLALFSVAVWVGVASTAVALPQLLKITTGLESEFTRSPVAALASSLFFTATVLATWLTVGPMWRVVVLLRTFYFVSRTTGADLSGRLQVVRRRTATAALAALCALVPLCPAQEAPAPAPAAEKSAAGNENVSPAEFEANLRRTLEQSDYRWRLPRELPHFEPNDLGLRGALQRFAKWMGDAITTFGHDVEKIWRKLIGSRRAGPPSPSVGSGGALNFEVVRGLLYLLGGIVLVGGLGWLVAMLVRWKRGPAVAAPATGGAAPVDLRSEEILASQLPEDEWLRLARLQLEQGEPRLAVRALFLAILALLGERRWVEIVRFKSNRDYRAELRARARARSEVQESFGESVGIFECVWYGLHEVQPERLQRIMDHYENLKRVPTT